MRFSHCSTIRPNDHCINPSSSTFLLDTWTSSCFCFPPKKYSSARFSSKPFKSSTSAPLDSINPTFHHFSSLFIAFHDFSWLFITFHRFSWLFMTFHHSSSLFTPLKHFNFPSFPKNTTSIYIFPRFSHYCRPRWPTDIILITFFTVEIHRFYQRLTHAASPGPWPHSPAPGATAPAAPGGGRTWPATRGRRRQRRPGRGIMGTMGITLW